MINGHRTVRHLLAMLIASVSFLCLVAGQAVASHGRVFERTFGGASSTTVDPYPLSSSDQCASLAGLCEKRIAVDSTTGHASSGDIYVADPNNHRIEKFDASGNFILMFGKNVNKTKVEEVGSTEAERDVCTAVSGDACQAGIEGSTPGAFVNEPLAVAVDSTSGPSSEDVYVANTTKSRAEFKKGEGAGEAVITKFDQNGKIVTSWGIGGQMHGSGSAFGEVGGITVDGSGNLWVSGTTEEEKEINKKKIFVPRPNVFELAQDGSLDTSWHPSRNLIQGVHGMAVDAEHHVYLVVGGADNEIMKIEASNGQFISEFTAGTYPAFDPTMHTIDVLPSETQILALEASCPGAIGFQGCPPTETITREQPHKWGPLAVNYGIPADTIYVEEAKREIAAEPLATIPDVASLPAAPVGAGFATLKGAVNPEGVEITKCVFEWGEGSGEYEHNAPCETPSAEEVGAGSTLVQVHARIAVQAGKAYHYRLVAANAVDAHEPARGADIQLGAPRIDSNSATQVTASSATFTAEIDPRNLRTIYHFEYLTEKAFEANGGKFSGAEPATSVPVPPGEVAAGQQDVSVSVHVNGLAIHSPYRYRVVAENVLGEGADASVGPAEPLLTWGAGAFSQLDGRGWEMVTPPDKRGALVEPIGEDWIIQAAAGGGRLAYVTRAPSESDPTGYLIYQSSLATRTSGGWTSRNLAIPHVSLTELSVGEGWEYRVFSEDLSHAIVQPFGPFVACTSESGTPQPCLSPQASEQTAFLASNYKEAASNEPCREGCYTPLVTGAEGVANVPPETVFGQTSVLGKGCPPKLYCGPKFLDATPDLGHVLLEAPAALGPSPAPHVVVPHNSIYEWSSGAAPSEQLRLVSVLPGDVSKEAKPAQESFVGFNTGQEDVRNSISGDGSRVVFTGSGSGESQQHLYLREHATQPQSPLGSSGECLDPADACTVQLDAGLSGVSQFQAANSEVTRIFFTVGTQRGISEDLYEYNVAKAERVRITTGAQVIGSVIGASEDGSTLYFTGDGALTPHAVAGVCQETESQPLPGDCNLYEEHYDGTHWEAPTLVAVLSSKDGSNWSGISHAYIGLAARVSPNGQWLAFMSSRGLTGYNNQDAVSSEPDSEVYEYDAATGSLVCASCNPSGARPHGVAGEQIDSSTGGLAGGDGTFGPGLWFAANLPPWTPSIGATSSVYQSRYLSDSGRLFFDSADALVSKDTNGTEDVYEYEPEGVPAGEHSCSATSESGGVTFKPSRDLQVEGAEVREAAGCVGLISSGESSQESAFLDATETGSEVFFITSAKLAKQDIDTSFDVYDSRECTSVSPCQSEAATLPKSCEEEASCKPPPSPPPGIFAPSGSATFSGSGNLVQPLTAAPASKPKPLTKAQLLARALKKCRKDKARSKRVACEKQARKRYGAKKASKSNNGQHGRGSR